jgi:DoxX-like family
VTLTRARWFKLLVLLSRFGLAAMFLFAAGAKLFTLRDFVANLANLVGTSWAWPVTMLIVVAELTTACLLIVPRAVRVGALLAALLLVGFAAYALFYVYVQHGEPLECGCFGRLIASQLGVSTAERNLLLLVPTLLVLFGYRRAWADDRSLSSMP